MFAGGLWGFVRALRNFFGIQKMFFGVQEIRSWSGDAWELRVPGVARHLKAPKAKSAGGGSERV